MGILITYIQDYAGNLFQLTITTDPRGNEVVIIEPLTE